MALKVTVLDIGKVEFDGKRFEVTTGVPQKGDIARVDKAWGNQIAGKFYRVINEEHPLFTNDADEYVYLEGEVGKASDKIDAVTLFREVTEQPKIKPGTKIRITNAWLSVGYENGDVLTVKEFVDDKTTFDGYAFAEETGNIAIMRREFEVIEEAKVAQEDEGEISFRPDGLVTEKRPAKVGDRILIVDAMRLGGQSHKNGDILTVTGNPVAFANDVYVAEQPRFIDFAEYEVILEEPLKEGDKVKLLDVSKGGLLGFETGGIYTVTNPYWDGGHDTEIFNGSGIYGYTDATNLEKVVEAPKPKYVPKNGDIVRVLERGSAMNLNVGDIGTVAEYSGKEGSQFRVMTETASKINWVRADAVELVTKAEDVEKEPEFKVGDFVVVTKDNYEHKEGDVMELTEERPDSFSFDFRIRNLTTGKKSGFIAKENIRKATAEEVEATKPKPKAPFQPGDIVLVQEEGYEGYAEVLRGPDGDLSGGNYRVDFGNGEGQKIVLGDFMVMIAPKDNRVD
jgi:hypothetical protein